jgi:LysR family glycine cleavage system transcriptional activator
MMKRRDLPLYALRGFEATARRRSLANAAEELGVSYSAISHQIRKLENILGTALFDRTHKPLRLTPKGHALLSGVTDSFDRLSHAAESVENTALEGRLTVSCVPGLGTNWFISVLGQFLKTYAMLEVHVVTEFWQHPTAHDEADLAIVYGSAEHSGRRVVRLGQSEFFPVCSPRIMAGLSKPQNLAGLTLLHEYSEETWSRWLLETGFDDIENRRDIYFDSAHLALEAARAGFGVAMGDRPTILRDLSEGRLIRLFDHSIPAIHPYYIVTPPLERMTPAAKALEAWIIEQF